MRAKLEDLNLKKKIIYLVSLAYVLAGWNVYTTKVPLALLRQADPSITAHTEFLTLHQIGLVFITVSVACILMTWKSYTEYAYALMTFTLVWWSLLYIVSWIETGYWQSIYGAANYVLTSGILILCSRIVETPKGMRESQNTPLPLTELENHLKGVSSS